MRRLIVARFFKAGLANNSKCLYLGNPQAIRPSGRPFFRDALLTKALSGGQLEIVRDLGFHRKGAQKGAGTSLESVAAGLEAMSAKAVLDGFSGLLVACEMEWLLGGQVGPDSHARVEAVFNRLVEERQCMILCLSENWDKAGKEGEPSEGRDAAAPARRERRDPLGASLLGQALADSRQPFFAASSEGRLLVCNKAFSRLTGFRESELLGLDWQRDLTVCGQAGHGGARPDEDSPLCCELIRKDGERLHVEIWRHQTLDERGRSLWQCCFVHDVTRRRQEVEALQFKACHDPLTALPNRALFMERLGHALELAKRRPSYRFAAAFLDLDDFKDVNDRHGHEIGDRILLSAAGRMKECLRGVDTLARLGGDEFVILLDDVDEPGALAVVERILENFREPERLGGAEIPCSVSIGLVEDGRDYERPEQILRDADAAMYRAKGLGKNRFAVFGRSQSPRPRAPMWREVGRALEKREFMLLYQPVVSLKNRRLAGFEALLRWGHPDRGMLRPPEFMNAAEEAGRAADIVRWTLLESCRQMRDWLRLCDGNPDFSVSVNLSGARLTPAQVLAQVDEAVGEAGLERGRLRLEIQRGDFRRDAEALSTFMLRLKEQDVHLTIDDFSVSWPALSRLRACPIVPVDAVKIDSSIIAGLAADARQADNVWTIAMLAQSLGIDVIAKGVENRDQVDRLAALKCEYGQGFYFSRPASAKRAEAMIRRGAVC